MPMELLNTVEYISKQCPWSDHQIDTIFAFHDRRASWHISWEVLGKSVHLRRQIRAFVVRLQKIGNGRINQCKETILIRLPKKRNLFYDNRPYGIWIPITQKRGGEGWGVSVQYDQGLFAAFFMIIGLMAYEVLRSQFRGRMGASEWYDQGPFICPQINCWKSEYIHREGPDKKAKATRCFFFSGSPTQWLSR